MRPLRRLEGGLMTGRRSYASSTTVPVERTRAEIEALLKQHGATGFGYAWEGPAEMIEFVLSGVRVRLILPMPHLDDFAYTARRQRRTATAQKTAWEQECKARWRALFLIIKAKLVAVDSGITTLETEFMAGVVLPDGRTLGQWVTPQLEAAISQDRMPPMLPAPERR